MFSFLQASICPLRRNDISFLVFRAMITGTCVSLINACIAGKVLLVCFVSSVSPQHLSVQFLQSSSHSDFSGILFVPPLDCVEVFNGSPFNATLSDVAECCQELFQRYAFTFSLKRSLRVAKLIGRNQICTQAIKYVFVISRYFYLHVKLFILQHHKQRDRLI